VIDPDFSKTLPQFQDRFGDAHEAAMPGEDRVGRDERRDAGEERAAEFQPKSLSLAPSSQKLTTALIPSNVASTGASPALADHAAESVGNLDHPGQISIDEPSNPVVALNMR
jgi:hypothetical protein